MVKEFVIAEADQLQAIWREHDNGAPEDKSLPVIQPVQESVNHHKVHRALDLIETSLSNPDLSVGGIASALGTSANYMSSIFARIIGCGMHEFINLKRVQRAQSLLVNTNLQIKQIASKTGHANPNWFTHLFRKHTGVTPSEFRDQGVVSHPSAGPLPLSRAGRYRLRRETSHRCDASQE